MQPNIDIWREPVARFEGLNVRQGATDLTNIDYVNFPPNYLCTYNTYEQYPDLLWNFVNSGNLTLENGIDESICYVGMKNPDLPQLNYTSHGRYGFYDENTPFFITDNTQIQGVFFIATGNALQFYNYFEWEGNAVYNEFYNYALGYKYRRYNGEMGQASYLSPQSNSNSNLFLNVYQKIGIKNFIFEIRVQYKTGYNQYGVVAAESTLAGYVAQTDEWKTAHPIVSAYGIPYWRYSTDGEYRNSSAGSNSKNITVAFTLPFVYSGAVPQENYSDIYNYAINYSNNTTCGYLPIYGSRGDHSEPKAVAQDHGKIGVLMGSNRGEYHYSFSSGYNNMWFELEGTADNIEWLRRGMAAYGLFFCDEIGTLAQSGKDLTRWIDDKMCLGTIDSDGLTNGDYTHGLDNTNQRQFNWKTTDESNYNPTAPVDPTIYSDTTDFNVLGGVASFNKMYAIDDSNLLMLAQALSTAINTRLGDLPPLDYSLETFLTSNPLDVIVSLRKYPVATLTTGTLEPIKFGAYENASVQGIPFIKSYDKITFTFSNNARNSLYKHFGDFRDYEPFTHAELIVPFCGTVAINPADFLGHDINVHMIIDYITGACTAYIAADGLVVTSISGTVGVDIPLSGIQQATLESQRVNAVMNRKSADINANNAVVGGLVSSIGFAGSLMGENVAGSIGSGAGLLQSINRFQQADLSYQKADYELKHMQLPFKQVTAGSPVASTVIENKCRLIIYRPVLDEKYNAAAYAETVGFACLMNGTIESLNLSGLTVANINTDGLQLTDTEKQMIQKAFAGGVII